MFRRSVVPARLRRRRMTNFGWESLCTAAQMDRILRREMARADRGGHCFSLSLFRVKSARHHPLSTHRLARALLRRARLTDVVGWFAEDYLCALLTDTPAQGARVFADRIALDLGAHAPRPLGVVYTYQPQTVPANGQAVAKGQAPDRPVVNSDSSPGVEQWEGRRHWDAAPQTVQIDLKRFVQQRFAAEMDAPALSDNSVEELMFFPLPAWKRAIDIVGSIVGMIVLSPLLLAAAIGILLTSPGPIIFRQRRTGLGGRPFMIYKFRTMVPGAERKRNELASLSEQDGPAFKMENDPRLTRFGRFLRKSSIDELPQLYNVLKGDMSLVGPRPLPCDESDACQPWQKRRLDVTPGLTCIWQVKGRSRVTFDEWVRMDMAYLRRRTFWNDVRILAATVPAVLLRKGAK